MEIKYAPSFKKSWDKLFAWYYAPLRVWRAFLNIPWELKYATQRFLRGWSDKDTWSMDFYLLSILPEMLKHLANNLNGCPASFYDESAPENQRLDKWKSVLLKAAKGFEQRREWESDYTEMLGYEWDDEKATFSNPEFKQLYEQKSKVIQAEFEESMDFLKTYFFTLWD